MVHAQNVKTVQQIAAQAIVDNAYFVGSHQGTNPVNVDTKGFAYAVAVVQLGALDIAVAEMSVYESDDTTDGNFTKITGSDFNISGTLPSATDDNKIYKVFIPLGGSRKRYLRWNLKGGDGSSGSFAIAYFDLSRANEAPNTASERGLGQQLFV